MTTEHPDEVLLKASDPVSEEHAIEMEADHYNSVVSAMLNYQTDSFATIRRAELQFLALSKEHRQLLAHWKDKFVLQRQAVKKNSQFLRNVANPDDRPARVFANQSSHLDQAHEDAQMEKETRSEDVDKLRSMLKHCMRDWSAHGEYERKMCYGPIIDAVNKRFGTEKRDDVSVLVPGCGLGRLVWEFAHLGYAAQGNEYSFFMLLCSHYILNRSSGVNSIQIYPFVHTNMNVRELKDTLLAVSIPDVNPSNLPENANFSMSAGDFVEVYGTEDQKEQWDCIATCYFLDTAHNIIEYIETIHSALKKGGIWVNLGPMLFHYADMPGVRSLEVTVEDLMELIRRIGFNVDQEQQVKSVYTQMPKTMLNYEYQCEYFVAMKQ